MGSCCSSSDISTPKDTLSKSEATDLGVKNVKLPKFVTKNQSSGIEIKAEKLTPPFIKDSNKWCYFLSNVFTESECKQLIKMSEKTKKYGPAYVRTNDGGQTISKGRTNSRVMIDSSQLAHFIFKRLEQYLPQTWPIKDETKDERYFSSKYDTKNLMKKGEYSVVTCNERLRFLRYFGGEEFAYHMDGPYVRDDKSERSFITVLIYLNSGFKGGETTFLDMNNETVYLLYPKEDRSKHLPVIPVTGSVLVFEHKIWHEGTKLIEGTKYLIRTDVMYKKIKND